MNIAQGKRLKVKELIQKLLPHFSVLVLFILKLSHERFGE
jgi:hypothetical protein